MTATLLSFVVFAVPPSKLDTRLQTAIGLFLSLIAVQFVIEGELPKSSYVIPVSWGEKERKVGERGRGRRREEKSVLEFLQVRLPILFLYRAQLSKRRSITRD